MLRNLIYHVERERERESRVIPATAFGADQLIYLFLNSTLNGFDNTFWFILLLWGLKEVYILLNYKRRSTRPPGK